MGKKNIKPNQPQPVIRTNVAKPALEGLTEENLTTTAQQHNNNGDCGQGLNPLWVGFTAYCSYDGDDAE